MTKSAGALVLGVALAWTVSASANASQAGCQAYGGAVAAFSQTGGTGALFSSVATRAAGALVGVGPIINQAPFYPLPQRRWEEGRLEAPLLFLESPPLSLGPAGRLSGCVRCPPRL